MTIQEAIKSGKRFRHIGWEKNQWVEQPSSKLACYTSELVSDDWEIEEEKIEITKSQIERVLSNEYLVSGTDKVSFLIKNVLKELGFK